MSVNKILFLFICLFILNESVFSIGKTYTVTTTNDSGAGSLRAAIDSVNANPTNASSRHNIVVTSGLISPYTITLASSLPNITQPVIIDGKIDSLNNLVLDGNTQGYIGFRLGKNFIEIKNLKFKKFYVNANARGLVIDSSHCMVDYCRFDSCLYAITINSTGNYNTVKNSVFNYTTGAHILTNGSNSIIFPSNHFIGYNRSGIGLSVGTGANNTIVGGEITSSGLMNIFEDLNLAINDLGSNSKYYGNLIGGPSKLSSDNCSGTDYGMPNNTGIQLQGTSAEIGKRGQNNDNYSNIIIGNISNGILINNGKKTKVYGNYIGIDKYSCPPAGTVPILQANQYGIRFIGTTDSTWIGPSVSTSYNAYDGNIICQMTNGVYGGGGGEISGGYVQVNGNFIGTDRNNSQGLGNRFGIQGIEFIDGNVIAQNTGTGITVNRKSVVQNNKIGTTSDGMGKLGNPTGISVTSAGKGTTIRNNLISGNTNYGISSVSDSITIIGNLIGPNINGDSLGNTGTQIFGIIITAGNGCIIGGRTSAERNIISGNNNGVRLVGNNHRVMGNYIGTNLSGTSPIKNTNLGIIMYAGARKIFIGGNRLLGEGNLIAGNGASGIGFNANADSCIIKGNYIGVNSAGTAISNRIGISISNGNRYHIIGSTIPEEGNIIANNISGYGINIESVTANVSANNKISGNTFYNNALKAIRLNYNTSSESNNGKPVPVIDSVKYMSPVQVIFKGHAQAGDSIEIFSGESAGKNAYTYIAHGLADGSGNWTITATVSSLENYYIATATGNPSDNTSELSIQKAGTCFFCDEALYAELKDELDASFHFTMNYDTLYFKYQEKYNTGSTGAPLNYKIYNYKRNALSTPVLTKYYGMNYFRLGLNGIISFGQEHENYYILEVINDKGEVKMLRFKYIINH